MDIYYLGHSSFRLKGKSVTVVTDPYAAAIGLKFPKHVTADIVTVSHDHEDHNAVGEIEGSPFVVSGPGEYEVKGVGVIGIGSYHDEENGAKRGKNTMYRIDIDNLTIVHLGDLGHTLSKETLEELGNVDILLVPCGGYYTIDAESAAKLVAQIEPRIVIPMHYKTERHDPKMFGELTGVEAILKELGVSGIGAVAKFTTTKDKLPEQMQVVVFE